MKTTVLPAAELEAVEAAIWYDEQRHGLGDEFLSELENSLNRVRDDPAVFATLETYRGTSDVRRCLLKRFPFVVIFVRRPAETMIVAVSHVRRRPLYWLERLG